MASGSTKVKFVFLVPAVLGVALAVSVQTGIGQATNQLNAPDNADRVVSGMVVDELSAAIVGATVPARWANGSRATITNDRGFFSIHAPAVPVTLSVTGKYVGAFHLALATDAPSQ